MSYFDPETWRVFTKGEMLTYLDRIKRDARRRGRGRRKKVPGILVLQRSISPFDAYTYLHARFGPPNGFQTFLAKDDSDNLFHWDYNLCAGKKKLLFTGASEEVHVQFDDFLSDADCIAFIQNLKNDFGRIGMEKARFASTLEKWSIFPNQYLTIANRCAELYDAIDRALPKVEKLAGADDLAARNIKSERARTDHPRLMSAITTAATELAILTPVMFESFVGLIVAVLIEPTVKQNQQAFSEFVRSPLNQKITQLADKCRGFEGPIKQNNPAFGRYWSVVNKRNDILHGNVDPVRDAVEVVYFHRKRPLFKSGGDRFLQHWIRVLDQYKPRVVIDDYIAAHAFIIEILNHLERATRRTMWLVMSDSQPGWDNRRKVFGRLFPDHIAMSIFEGLRYDWQLRA